MLVSWLWKQYGFLIAPYSLTNFEIQKYYKNEPTFNSVYSRDIINTKRTVHML